MRRAGTVCIAGAPNVGKSTLLNRMLGRRLSITTNKPQTTRVGILGVHAVGDTQIVFTDTPGIHEARSQLQQRMVGTARRGLRDADVVCWVLAAERGVSGVDRGELSRIADRPLVAAINKCDRVTRPEILPLIAGVASLVPRAEIIPVSALTGENVPALVAALVELMPEGEWMYPAEALTDRPTRFFVGELVREQVFKQLQQELPYRTAVLVDSFEERAGGPTVISAAIYVDSLSARKIVVGKEGQRIKAIGVAARKTIESFLAGRVYLDLHVRVKKDWQSDSRFLEELGLA